MAGISSHQPEWHSDEVGIVRLIDPYGRPQRYEIKGLVAYGKATYAILEPSHDKHPYLVCRYVLGWNGDAWVEPISHSVLTFVILCLSIWRQSNSRLGSQNEVYS